MSWKYDKTTMAITMTKGDTPTFPIRAKIRNEDDTLSDFIPDDDAQIIFACKAKGDKNPLFIIEVPHDTMAVTFKQEHTKDLEEGNYIYEVSLNIGEYHETFITDKKLKLTTEIY